MNMRARVRCLETGTGLICRPNHAGSGVASENVAGAFCGQPPKESTTTVVVVAVVMVVVVMMMVVMF